MKNLKNAIPVRNYEKFKTYIDRMIEGESDILWPGKPVYFCKTSGTTSGIKYIPIFKNAIKTHINSAREILY